MFGACVAIGFGDGVHAEPSGRTVRPGGGDAATRSRGFANSGDTTKQRCRGYTGVHYISDRRPRSGTEASARRSRSGRRRFTPELLRLGPVGVSPPMSHTAWRTLGSFGSSPRMLRRYSIGAELLDIDDPTRSLGSLETPLLVPESDERDGYVPNVVYTCGAIAHQGWLVIPFGSEIRPSPSPPFDSTNSSRPAWDETSTRIKRDRAARPSHPRAAGRQRGRPGRGLPHNRSMARL